MPELPEVETVRRALRDALVGRRLAEADIRRSDLRWPVPRGGVRALVGRTLTAIDRRSKYLLLRFDHRAKDDLLVHLGMSGRVLLVPSPRARRTEWVRHEHWRMRFGRWTVRFIDPRRFGALLTVAAGAAEAHPLLAHLGPEPLADELDAEFWFRRSRKRRTTLKAFLLDARNVAGVGNIYACEACFEAGVLPQARVHRLSRSAWRRILRALRRVLGRALAAGGTTLRDYAGAGGDPGGFQLELRVYGRAGLPCRGCGDAVKVIQIQGRSTFYCSRCQRASA